MANPASPSRPRSAGPARRGGRRGFTLMEVLATMLLMAIVLPVAMHGVSVCLQVAGVAKRSAEAATLAEGKLAELAATSTFLPGDLSGDFSPDFPNYQWKAQTSTTADGLEEITVWVTYPSRTGERSVNVTTWVYRATDLSGTSGTTTTGGT